jgi:hypothetical protein
VDPTLSIINGTLPIISVMYPDLTPKLPLYMPGNTPSTEYT